MNIHEYQAKELFEKFGVPSPNGKVAGSAAEAQAAAEEIGGGNYVVKAQVHAGGRGKGCFKTASKAEFTSTATLPKSAKSPVR